MLGLPIGGDDTTKLKGGGFQKKKHDGFYDNKN
jgi:hypothetical protein